MLKTGKELAAACKNAAENFETLYVYGSFGWPMDEAAKDRALRAQSYNRLEQRRQKIKAADDKTFGFDCVGLIKALLWGWEGRYDHVYGGAVYASNCVSDLCADVMFAMCRDQSADFSNIQEGEAVWLKGHIGVYIGDGLAVECTPKWADGVQITAVHNMGKKYGYNGRSWTKHGKIHYLRYDEERGDYTLELRNLKRGSRGSDVKALQLLLAGNGQEPGTADGIFGVKTDGAVRAYQQARGLRVDGIAGKNTMAALLGVSGNE